MADLTTIDKVEAAWRPLTGDKRTKAVHYIGVASRLIHRRWRDVDARIASGELDPDDVSDVVVDLVLGVVGGPPVRHARSWSESAGSMSQSITLDAGAGSDPLVLEQWMIEIFEGVSTATALPAFHAPPSGRYDRMFQWSENVP